tara:strand:- start:1815 stop:2060 length:246 start_codon:yes stop_codon:yes gene_type:complete
MYDKELKELQDEAEAEAYSNAAEAYAQDVSEGLADGMTLAEAKASAAKDEEDDCPTCKGSTEGCRDCYDTCGFGPIITDEN